MKPSKVKQKVKVNSHMLVGCLTDDMTRKVELMIPINVRRGSSHRLNRMKITTYKFDNQSNW